MPSNQGPIRDNKGRFVKGSSGNPTGKNAGRPPMLDLEKALLKAQRIHNKSFLDHLVERAYESDAVAIALAKKLISDKLEATDINIKPIFQNINIEGKSFGDRVRELNAALTSQFNREVRYEKGSFICQGFYDRSELRDASHSFKRLL